MQAKSPSTNRRVIILLALIAILLALFLTISASRWANNMYMTMCAGLAEYDGGYYECTNMFGTRIRLPRPTGEK